MKVNLKFDTRAFDRFGEKAAKRMAYGVIAATNKTALDVQAGIQTNVASGRTGFTVRQRQFITRMSAKIDRTNFANARRGQVWAEVAVGHAPRLLLAKFEEGGDRLPFVGKNVAMPVIGGPARRKRTSRVPRNLWFENLHLEHQGDSPVLVSSDGRLYLIPDVGLFRRRSRTTSELVYAFTPKLDLRRQLDFVFTARRIAAKRFNVNLKAEIADSIRRAGG